MNSDPLTAYNLALKACTLGELQAPCMLASNLLAYVPNAEQGYKKIAKTMNKIQLRCVEDQVGCLIEVIDNQDGDACAELGHYFSSQVVGQLLSSENEEDSTPPNSERQIQVQHDNTKSVLMVKGRPDGCIEYI